MNKRRQFLRFVVRAMLWGTILGAVASIPLVYVILWIYSYFGFVMSIGYGILIGLLNGLALGALTFYFPAVSEKVHRRRMLVVAIGLTVVLTYLLYFPFVYPVFTIVPYEGYDPGAVSPLGGYGICISPIAFGAALIAAFASGRVRYRASSQP